MGIISRILNIIKVVFHKPYDTSTADGRSKERARKIALTALAAAVSKVFATIIPLITVKLTLQYLGVELYGLWNAVTSFFAMFVFADLGLGNGVQTLLSRAYGYEDKEIQQKIIINAYIILSCIALFLIIAFLIIYPYVDWAELMNATDNTSKALVGGVILAIVIPKFLSIPLSLVQRVQLAYQEGYNSHWWQCGASVLSLVSIYAICKYDLGELFIIWSSTLIPVIVFILNSFFYYSRSDRKIYISGSLIDSTIAKQLFGTGMAFFVLSILTTLGLSIDTFLVAKLGSLQDAAPYSILYKIAHFISMICAMVSTPMWSANGEAMAKEEYDWVRRNTYRVSIISIGFSLFVSVVLVLFSDLLFGLWLGQNFVFSKFCLIGMAITQIILSGISPFFMVLNAAGIIKKQIIVFLAFTVISLVVKILVVPYCGINYIPWITDVCYVFCIVPFVVHWSNKLFADKGLR